MASTRISNVRHRVYPRTVCLIDNDTFNAKWEARFQECCSNNAHYNSRRRLCGECRCPGHVRTNCPVVKIPRGTDQEKVESIVTQMRTNNHKTLYSRQAYLMEFMRKDPRFHIGICPKTLPGYEGMSREFIEVARDRFTARNEGRSEARREARAAEQAALRPAPDNILDQPRSNGQTLRQVIEAAQALMPGRSIRLVVRGETVAWGQHVADDGELLNPFPFSRQEPRQATRTAPAPAPPAPPVEPKPAVTVKDKVIDEKFCPICMDELTECNRMVGACGHQFHATCMMTWASQPRTAAKECPCCRSRLFE